LRFLVGSPFTGACARTALSYSVAPRQGLKSFDDQQTGAFMSANTSVGRGPASGGNENHDGDPRNKTLGEAVKQEPPAGSAVDLEQIETDVPAGVPGSKAKPGIRKGPDSYPDGPNVEDSPWELDAARGKLPPA
jgi:hypothetical protein